MKRRYLDMKMTKAYIDEVQKRLGDRYPHARTELHYSNPLEILIATILSAQCTDQRVNMVTPGLFAKYPEAEAYYNVPREELEKDIHSTGFYRNKARAIQGSAQMIVEQYGGKVPSTMEELLKLPGVARKTANCVLGNAYGIPSGIVVDTHVFRVSGRLGLTSQKNTDRVEEDLMTLIPRENWIDFSHWLIHLGRGFCKARKPLCRECYMNDICPSAGKVAEK